MQVVLTVDTEPSVAGAFVDLQANRPLIHEPVWGEVAGRSEALGFLIRTLSRYGLTATFFVETVHTTHFTAQPMGRYVAALAEADQDVQLHLHPVWCNFRSDGNAAGGQISDNCHEIDENLLVSLIGEGADQIESWTGQRPTGMRTGNFSTNQGTFTAMRRAGLRYSSNICAALPATSDPALNLPGGVHAFDGIVELPVTCFADRGPVGRGRRRHLQVTACIFTETKSKLNRLHAVSGVVAVIVTHPFEYLKSDDYRYTNMRANRMVQGRLEKLCAFLVDNADRFDTVPLDCAARALTPQSKSPALVGCPVNAIFRAAQNIVNDRIL